MLDFPSKDLIALIERVCVKRNWTQYRLGQELDIGGHTISRWKATGRIQSVHHRELLRLEKDEDIAPIQAITHPIRIPFSVTIPRDSLRIAMDKNGNIEISGELVGMVNKEGQ